MKKSYLLLFLALILSACSPNVERYGYRQVNKSQKKCDIAIFRDRNDFDLSKKIGTIKINGDGMFTRYSYAKALKIIRQDACGLKADYVNIFYAKTSDNPDEIPSEVYADFYKGEIPSEKQIAIAAPAIDSVKTKIDSSATKTKSIEKNEIYSENTIVSEGYYTDIDSSLFRRADKFSLGGGIGLDYGGIGANFTAYPHKNIGFFLGVGYPFVGVGYNVGVKFRIIPSFHAGGYVPFFTAMYGYNSAFKVEGASEFNKIFYGPSISVGCDYYPKKNSSIYWSFGVILPFRSSESKNYLEKLENTLGLEKQSDQAAVLFSIGLKAIIK